MIQNINDNKTITLPIIFLSIFVLFTFLPAIYTYVPILGVMKIVLIGGIGLLISYFFSSRKYTNYFAYSNPIFIAWLGFLVTMFLGMLTSYDRGITLELIIAQSKNIVVFIIMIKIIDTENRLDFIIKIFSFCGVGMALSTLLNFFVFKNTFQNSYRAMGVGSGIFGDPNDLALLFDVTLPFLLFYYFKSKKRTIPLLAISIVVLAVIITYSRGGFLGLCSVLLGSMIFLKDKRAKIITLVIMATVLFIALAPVEYVERISTIFTEAQVDKETNKYPGRLQNWIEILPSGLKSPLVGAGAGCSLYLFGQLNQTDFILAHNSFLMIFLEMGFLGLGFFIMIFIYPCRQYYQQKNYLHHAGETSNIERYKFILLSFLAFAVTGFFLPQGYSPIIFFLSSIALIQHELAVKAIGLSNKETS